MKVVKDSIDMVEKIEEPTLKKRKIQASPEPETPAKVSKLSLDLDEQHNNNPETEPESSNAPEKSKKEKQKEQSLKFRYGNFHRYYGNRLKGIDKDPRMECFNRDWFRRRNVLDIGCNAGYLTLSIAKEFDPAWVLGIDIDPHLVGACRKNIKHYCEGEESSGPFPASMFKTEEEEGGTAVRKFPNNVWFRTQNYVPEFEEQIEQTREEYDVILALSIAKWIHLNWGDDGMKRFFRKVYKHLRPGGQFILETQAYESYYKRAKTVDDLMQNYKKIEFKPEQFHDYLMNEIGFDSCEDRGVPRANAKGFERPLQVYKKKFVIKRPNTKKDNNAGKKEK